MTPDTRTTENPGPRTEAGRTLLNDLVEHVESLSPSDADAMWSATSAAILAIEAEAAQQALAEIAYDPARMHADFSAEAAQGAAPRAEGLDEAARRAVVAIDRAVGKIKDYERFGSPLVDAEVILLNARQALAARLAPQERRDND